MRMVGGLHVIGMDEPPAAFVCRICRSTFTADETSRYEQHVVKCSAVNEEHLINASLRTRLPGLFGPEAGDPELEGWIRRHGRVP
jgi:hypothetical protein